MTNVKPIAHGGNRVEKVMRKTADDLAPARDAGGSAGGKTGADAPTPNSTSDRGNAR